jgi:hypothetical protein
VATQWMAHNTAAPVPMRSSRRSRDCTMWERKPGKQRQYMQRRTVGTHEWSSVHYQRTVFTMERNSSGLNVRKAAPEIVN